MRKLLALVLVPALIAAAPAAKSPPPPRPAPSKTVAGIELDAPLQVSECALENHGFYSDYAIMARGCYRQSVLSSDKKGQPLGENDEVEIWPDAPLPRGVAGDITVKLVNGKVAEMTLRTTGNSSQLSVLDSLTEKFGKPTLSSQVPVQNMMGAQFTETRAVWTFSDLEVTFFGLMKIDEGMIIIKTPAAQVEAKPNPKF